MNFSPKAAWRNIKLLKDSFIAHHVINNLMTFSCADRSIMKNDREVFEVLVKHFTKVYDHSAHIDWEFINSIPYYSVFHEIAGIMNLRDLDKALFHLT